MKSGQMEWLALQPQQVESELSLGEKRLVEETRRSDRDFEQCRERDVLQARLELMFSMAGPARKFRTSMVNDHSVVVGYGMYRVSWTLSESYQMLEILDEL